VTVEELRAWCKERLAGYKVPKSFHVRDEVPLLPIGKVDKQALKKEILHAK
jgi:acyl-CoA synthetase (AMP-forming)/AMP-acid ligase II